MISLHTRFFTIMIVFMLTITHIYAQDKPMGKILVPKVDGKWWSIAGNPDLGQYNSSEQEPTAYGIWQAADGTFQLWGCIRKTNVGGNTRLFYRWQGDKITDTDWKPMEVAMIADPNFGETPGGIQTPHATKIGTNISWCMVTGRISVLPEAETEKHSHGSSIVMENRVCSTKDWEIIHGMR